MTVTSLLVFSDWFEPLPDHAEQMLLTLSCR